MRKFVWFILIAATLAELTASARIKIDPASLGRQERRLEDSGRHYNVGYVEYKSDVVDEKRLFRHSNDSEEEIDEYVVIESDVKSNVAADDVDDDRRYEEVDDHYDADDDEDEDDDRIVSNSVPHRGLVPQLWSNYSGPTCRHQNQYRVMMPDYSVLTVLVAVWRSRITFWVVLIWSKELARRATLTAGIRSSP